MPVLNETNIVLETVSIGDIARAMTSCLLPDCVKHGKVSLKRILVLLALTTL